MRLSSKVSNFLPMCGLAIMCVCVLCVVSKKCVCNTTDADLEKVVKCPQAENSEIYNVLKIPRWICELSLSAYAPSLYFASFCWVTILGLVGNHSRHER